MKIQPLADRILVTPTEAETVSPAGIHLVEHAKQKPQTGVVVAVGPGKMLEDGTERVPDVEPGDKIIFGQYGGTEVTLDGETYLMMTADDVLGVIEEN